MKRWQKGKDKRLERAEDHFLRLCSPAMQTKGGRTVGGSFQKYGAIRGFPHIQLGVVEVRADGWFLAVSAFIYRESVNMELESEREFRLFKDAGSTHSFLPKQSHFSPLVFVIATALSNRSFQTNTYY